MRLFVWLLLVCFLYHAPVEVLGIVYTTINWRKIKVPPPTDKTATYGRTFLDVARTCVSLESCKAICKSGANYVMTSDVLDSNLCYDEKEVVIQCWTSESSMETFFRFISEIIIIPFSNCFESAL